MSTDALPVAEVVSVTPTKTTRLVVICCPICGRTHQHGWPFRSATIGSRVAHCHRPHVPTGAPGGYFIPTPTEETP